tara:strand:- start:31 stop:312 length:282 start_codon:yes stop_codon:yes gene_type:complete
LSRKKLIRQLKLKNQKLNQSELEEVLDIFCRSLVDSLKQGQNIELRGFGTFFVKRIKEKFSARNPKTGEIIYVPEKNKVRFKPSKKLKEYINK